MNIESYLAMEACRKYLLNRTV